MPIIRVEMFEGRSIEQKRELVETFTKEAVRILKCGPDSVHVVLENRSKEDWGMAGKLMSDV